MPLRNHFAPPPSQRSSWEVVHGGWPMVIVQQLGKLLPPQFVAGPRIHLGSRAEVDVATFEHDVSRSFEATGSVPGSALSSIPGSVATEVWLASGPTLQVETELGEFDEYEVRIYDSSRNRRLVAVVELISPANKNRPESRQQFVSKCAALLKEHVSVVLVHIVPTREFNLYAELLRWVGRSDLVSDDAVPVMYAVACRWSLQGNRNMLESWNQKLQIGESLPILPLWLAENLAVPLDLEASYEKTCFDLRIAGAEF